MNDFSNDNSSRPTGIYTNNNISTSNISNNYIYDNISISPIISRNASPNTSDIVIKNIHNKVIVGDISDEVKILLKKNDHLLKEI